MPCPGSSSPTDAHVLVVCVKGLGSSMVPPVWTWPFTQIRLKNLVTCNVLFEVQGSLGCLSHWSGMCGLTVTPVLCCLHDQQNIFGSLGNLHRGSSEEKTLASIMMAPSPQSTLCVPENKLESKCCLEAEAIWRSRASLCCLTPFHTV